MTTNPALTSRLTAGLLPLALSCVAALAGAQGAAAAAPVAAAATVDPSTPNSLIESAANTMLRELDTRRAEFRKEPQKLYSLVDRVLLPYFDVDYAARLVLGKNWRAATAEQRKRFVDAFYRSLLNNYGDALIDFTGDRIKVLPAKVDPAATTATTATVRTEVRRSNGQKVPVNYTLRRTDAGWRAWDVVIEGISYVKSFREDFGAEIDQKGLDAVIKRLEAQATPAPAKAAR
jgi:phospholipid transport system substrate-binding protein